MKTIRKPLTLIFLGLQGCGKGTQVAELSKRYKFDVLEPGGIFRKMAKTSKGPREAIVIMKQGKLVPSKITNQIMRKEISKIKKNDSLIFDGYPRSIGQAHYLDRILKDTGRINNYCAILLKISKKTALHRLINRWICSKCGKIYSGNKIKCSCGGKLEKRQDEKPRLIKNRFRYVSRDLDKINSYYKKRSKLIEINAEKPVITITKDIIKKVGI